MSLEIRCQKCGMTLAWDREYTSNQEILKVRPCECCVATQGDHGEVVDGFGHSTGSSVDMDAENVVEDAMTNQGADFNKRLFDHRKRVDLGIP